MVQVSITVTGALQERERLNLHWRAGNDWFTELTSEPVLQD